MGTKIVIDKEQETAFIRRTGHINRGEMIKGTKDLESHPLFHIITKSLSDLSTADFSDISAYEFEAHAEYCATRLKNLKIALVAPNDLTFGVSRRFEILSCKENILVTREINEALSWLNVVLPQDF